MVDEHVGPRLRVDLGPVEHLRGQVARPVAAVDLLGRPEHRDVADQRPAEALLRADPQVDRQRERILLTGEVPSPINPPKGCNFCTRCKYATERCRTEEPILKDVGGGHMVACHMVQG